MNVAFDYATCDIICLPAHANFQLKLASGNVAKTMSSIKFSKYKNQIPKKIKHAQSKLISAVLGKDKKLNLTFSQAMKNDIFITDSKNRFYKNLSKGAEHYQYGLFGLPPKDDYFETPIKVFYKDGSANYQTEILVTHK